MTREAKAIGFIATSVIALNPRFGNVGISKVTGGMGDETCGLLGLTVASHITFINPRGTAAAFVEEINETLSGVSCPYYLPWEA